jgi:hypothetical protein
MRRQLAIKPKTRLAIYRRGDKLVVTKLKLPTAGEELDEFFAKIDERGKRAPSERYSRRFRRTGARREREPSKAGLASPAAHAS